MPAKKTNFIPYACFGYYDKQFAECGACKHKKPCRNATNSDKFEQVRKIFKYKNSQIDELVKEWTNKK